MKPKKTLAERRAYWHSHLQQAEQQKLLLSDYAKQHALDVKSLYRWKSRLMRLGALNDAGPAFVKVVASDPLPAFSANIKITLPNGICLDVTGDMHAMAAVVKSLGQL